MAAVLPMAVPRVTDGRQSALLRTAAWEGLGLPPAGLLVEHGATVSLQVCMKNRTEQDLVSSQLYPFAPSAFPARWETRSVGRGGGSTLLGSQDSESGSPRLPSRGRQYKALETEQ